jgi:hypothetical protein
MRNVLARRDDVKRRASTIAKGYTTLQGGCRAGFVFLWAGALSVSLLIFIVFICFSLMFCRWYFAIWSRIRALEDLEPLSGIAIHFSMKPRVAYRCCLSLLSQLREYAAGCSVPIQSEERVRAVCGSESQRLPYGRDCSSASVCSVEVRRPCVTVCRQSPSCSPMPRDGLADSDIAPPAATVVGCNHPTCALPLAVLDLKCLLECRPAPVVKLQIHAKLEIIVTVTEVSRPSSYDSDS